MPRQPAEYLLEFSNPWSAGCPSLNRFLIQGCESVNLTPKDPPPIAPFILSAAKRTADSSEPGDSSITCTVLTFQSPSAAVGFGLICRRRGFRPKAKHGGKGMFHLLWYLIIGLLAGLISKSVMHVHMTLFWTIVLGIVGSVLGGGITHMVSRARNERYHPAGLIFSTLGAIVVLFICYKLKIHLP